MTSYKPTEPKDDFWLLYIFLLAAVVVLIGFFVIRFKIDNRSKLITYDAVSRVTGTYSNGNRKV